MGNLITHHNNTAARHRHHSSNRTRSNPSTTPPLQHPQPHPQPQPQPQSQPVANHYVFAASTPYPTPYTNPSYYQHQYQPPGYYPAPTPPPPPGAGVPTPYEHHRQPHAQWSGRYPCGPIMGPPTPFVEHQKAVTIRIDVNIKKETLRVEADEDSPGKFLLSFTFDATVAGSITVIFFAKEGEDCDLRPTKESLLPPVIVNFDQGLGQKFKQPSGTGIDFSMFAEAKLLKEDDMDVYPLAGKADACLVTAETVPDGGPVPVSTNSHIIQAVFDKDKGEYKVKMVKQILWVSGIRYELQEIYGIGNSVESDFDDNDPGKDCYLLVRAYGHNSPPLQAHVYVQWVCEGIEVSVKQLPHMPTTCGEALGAKGQQRE